MVHGDRKRCKGVDAHVAPEDTDAESSRGGCRLLYQVAYGSAPKHCLGGYDSEEWCYILLRKSPGAGEAQPVAG